MSPEISKNVLLGLACAAVFLLIGFSPLWFSKSEPWSASTISSTAMPTGESKPAGDRITAPFASRVLP